MIFPVKKNYFSLCPSLGNVYICGRETCTTSTVLCTYLNNLLSRFQVWQQRLFTL